MVKKKTKKLMSNIMFWIGVAIVAITHIGIIAMGLPQELIRQHAAINLFAVILIAGNRYVK